jgi:hypothetical protein
MRETAVKKGLRMSATISPMVLVWRERRPGRQIGAITDLLDGGLHALLQIGGHRAARQHARDGRDRHIGDRATSLMPTVVMGNVFSSSGAASVSAAAGMPDFHGCAQGLLTKI